LQEPKSHLLNPLKRLAGQTAIYGLSSIIGRLLNYLLVPLYTRVFLTHEYGVVVEMYAYVAFLIVILTYGMETAFFRFSQSDPARRDTVFSTSLLSVAFTSSLFIILVIAFNQPLASLLRYPQHPEYITWFGIIIGLDAITAIPFARLRAENKPLKFATIKLINIGVNIGLNLFFLLLCPWLLEHGPQALQPYVSAIYNPEIGVGYVFISNLLASIFTFMLLLPVMLRTRLMVQGALLRQMLIYALPLLVAGLAGTINEALDKLLLKYMLPGEIAQAHVGIYGACYKISIMMTIFIQAFRFAAEPFFFAQSDKKDAPELYARVMKYFVVVCLLIFLGIMLFMDVVQHFVGEEYREGLGVVPILLIANMFLGIYFNLSIWYKLTGQTRYGAYVAVIGAIITLLLNIWWIPIIGYYGSAWATLVCYFSMTTISYLWGQKHYPVPYDVRRIIFFIAGAVILYLASTVMPELPSLLHYLLNVAIISLFLGMVLVLDRSMLSDLKSGV
jgi:O-antigen/teichoic acid export membrane protein